MCVEFFFLNDNKCVHICKSQMTFLYRPNGIMDSLDNMPHNSYTS